MMMMMMMIPINIRYYSYILLPTLPLKRSHLTSLCRRDTKRDQEGKKGVAPQGNSNEKKERIGQGGHKKDRRRKRERKGELLPPIM
jgi:hypothetical protein